MKATGLIGGIILIAALAVAVLQWRATEALRAENAALRAQLEAATAHSGTATGDTQKHEAELQKLRGDVQELVRLRGEITQLRSSNKEAEKLRTENQQLRTANQQLRGTTATENANATAPAKQAPNTFPREQWTFAGYQSPEAALVSAIWSMQQGNPKQYFESLTPEEQQRMTKAWEGKSAEEIAAKQKSDTAQITGFRVLQIDSAAETEQIITVAVDGPDRQERVRIQRIGNDWKFGGFIRDPK